MGGCRASCAPWAAAIAHAYGRPFTMCSPIAGQQARRLHAASARRAAAQALAYAARACPHGHCPTEPALLLRARGLSAATLQELHARHQALCARAMGISAAGTRVHTAQLCCHPAGSYLNHQHRFLCPHRRPARARAGCAAPLCARACQPPLITRAGPGGPTYPQRCQAHSRAHLVALGCSARRGPPLLPRQPHPTTVVALSTPTLGEGLPTCLLRFLKASP